MPNLDTLFLIENSEKIEAQYEGTYIAIHDKKVVASGKTIHEVYSLTDELGIDDPLVTYVPRSGEELLLI